MANKPRGLRWRSSTFFIISTVAIGLFTDLFLYGLVVPILPFILQERVQIPQSQIQSYVSGLLAAYAGASVALSPPAGVLADKLSTRRMPFLLGLTALFGATAMFAFGQSIAVLVVARVLQGISAAFVWTIGLAMLLDTVGPENLGKTIGSIFGFISIGELAAPVLGGVLYKKAGYAGVFGLAFALLAIDFIMRLIVVEKKVAARFNVKEDADGREQPQSDESDEGGQEPTEDDALIAKKEDDSAFKVPPEQPRWIRSYPIAYCLKDPRLLVALLLAFVQATLLSSFDATIPTRAEETYNYDSLSSGLLFVPLVLPYLLLGPVFGWAVDRYGTKPAATFGFGYLAPILILFRLPHAGGTSQIVLYCAVLALSGVGLGMIGSPSIVESAYIVQRYHKANMEFFGEQGPYAQLYGLNSMVFSAGLTLGPLLTGALKDSIGYGNAHLALAGICAVTAVLSFVYIGGPPRLSMLWKKKKGG